MYLFYEPKESVKLKPIDVKFSIKMNEKNFATYFTQCRTILKKCIFLYEPKESVKLKPIDVKFSIKMNEKNFATFFTQAHTILII